MEYIKLKDVCLELFAGGDVDKNNFSKEKTDEYSVPIFTNGEENNGLYGYTNKARVEKTAVTISGRGTIGFTCLRTEPFYPAVRLLVAVPNTDLIRPKYVKYFIESKKYGGRGASIPQLTIPMIKDVLIPLLPLEIQDIEIETMDKIISVIDADKKQLELLDEAVKSRFIEMFGDPLLNEMKYPTKPLAKVCPFNKYKGDVECVNGNYWILNLDMVEPNTGRVIDKLYQPIEKIGNSTIIFDENCVLYSKLRPYLNKVVIPDSTGYATSEMISMQTGKKINKYFLASLIRSDSFVSYINSKTAGAKMPRASMDHLRDFELIIPEIEKQNEFEKLVKQIDKSKFNIQQHLNLMQELLDKKMEEFFGE